VAPTESWFGPGSKTTSAFRSSDRPIVSVNVRFVLLPGLTTLGNHWNCRISLEKSKTVGTRLELRTGAVMTPQRERNPRKAGRFRLGTA
jgi:hypothetical protein